MSKHSNSTHFVQVPRRPTQAMLRVLDDNVGDTVANGRALAAGIWRDMLDLATKAASGPLRNPTIVRLRELGERCVSQPTKCQAAEIQEAGEILLAVVGGCAEMVIWHSPDQPPEDDDPVQLATIDKAEPTCMGVRDGSLWRTTDGLMLSDQDVMAWAYKLSGPLER